MQMSRQMKVAARIGLHRLFDQPDLLGGRPALSPLH
jgi:hypothetical protein